MVGVSSWGVVVVVKVVGSGLTADGSLAEDRLLDQLTTAQRSPSFSLPPTHPPTTYHAPPPPSSHTYPRRTTVCAVPVQRPERQLGGAGHRLESLLCAQARGPGDRWVEGAVGGSGGSASILPHTRPHLDLTSHSLLSCPDRTHLTLTSVIFGDPPAGRHAFVGMGFLERSDAFDFNVALQDHVK